MEAERRKRFGAQGENLQPLMRCEHREERGIELGTLTRSLPFFFEYGTNCNGEIVCRPVDRAAPEAATGVDRVYPEREVLLGYGRLETCF